jgi:hypothetical protein
MIRTGRVARAAGMMSPIPGSSEEGAYSRSTSALNGRLVEKVDVDELLADHRSMMSGKGSLRCLSQGWQHYATSNYPHPIGGPRAEPSLLYPSQEPSARQRPAARTIARAHPVDQGAPGDRRVCKPLLQTSEHRSSVLAGCSSRRNPRGSCKDSSVPLR